MTTLIQPSFAGGEISLRLGARVDLARYQSSAAAIENFIVRPEGGLIRRLGTRFAGVVKYGDSISIPVNSVRGEQVCCRPIFVSDDDRYTVATSVAAAGNAEACGRDRLRLQEYDASADDGWGASR